MLLLQIIAAFVGVGTMYGLCFALSRWRTKSRLALAFKASLYPAAICSIAVGVAIPFALTGVADPSGMDLPRLLEELPLLAGAFAAPVFLVTLYWTRPGQRPTINPRT